MKSMPPGFLAAESPADRPRTRLQALRAYESRLRELQGLRVPHEGLRHRNLQLRITMDAAVKRAHSCATGGGFRQASAGDLAALVNNFSRLRRFPVTQGVDSILSLAMQEVSLRSVEGGLGGWTAKQLAQLTCGLSKAEGPGLRDTLTHLAQALPGGQQLTDDQGWTAQPLAMMANGLGKGEGKAVHDALNRLAGAVCCRPLETGQDWTVQHLAMMINGLAKGEGPDILAALAHLARAVTGLPSSPVGTWHARDLSMVINGLAKGRIEEVRSALTRLAQMINQQDSRAESGWTARDLAMTVNGLGKGSGGCVEQALSRLAQAISHREQTEGCHWTVLELAMMSNGLSRHDIAAAQPALACLARQISIRQLTPAQGWAARTLAMVANGLSHGEGPDIQAALTQLARAVRQWPGLQGWTARDLAMMANGLARGEAVEEALTCLARAVCSRELTASQGWSAQHLAMTLYGLGKGSGKLVQEALTRLAIQVRGRAFAPDEGWTPRAFAAAAHGLGKGRGPGVAQALTHLAARVREQDLTQEKEWTALSLAMVAYGLSRGPQMQQMREALSCLAQAAQQRNLAQDPGWTTHARTMLACGLAKGRGAAVRAMIRRLADDVKLHNPTVAQGWTTQQLAMMFDATGRTLPGHPLFAELAGALSTRVEQEPDVVAFAVIDLSSSFLSGVPLAMGRFLLEALETVAFLPRSQRKRGGLLWSTTLLHFACQQQSCADQETAAVFARAFRYYHACQLAGTPDDRPGPDHDDHWHNDWSCDYWQPSCGPDSGRPVLLERGCQASAPSFSQEKIFAHLQAQLPGHELEMEVRINHFPVDILIDRHICVEVDGPSHFVELAADEGAGAEAGYLEERLTKDLFVDHMLHRYGYLVFRVRESPDPEQLQALVASIRSVQCQ